MTAAHMLKNAIYQTREIQNSNCIYRSECTINADQPMGLLLYMVWTKFHKTANKERLRETYLKEFTNCIVLEPKLLCALFLYHT